MQTWPLLAKPLQTAACAARGRSASASTIIGDLPPSSSTAGTRRAAAACATCLPVDGAAGEEDHVGRRGQRRAHVAAARHHLEHAVGHAGLARQLRDPQRRQRRVLRRLQHDRVARGERRDAVGVVVEQRPVPRPDDGHHAARVADDARPLVGEHERMAQVVGQRPASGPARVVARQLERVEELDALRLVARLAALGRQGVEERRVVAQGAGEPAQDARPFAERQRPPGRLGRPRRGPWRRRPRRVGGRDLLDQLAGGGVR